MLTRPTLFALCGALAMLAACQNDPTEGSLSENVGAAFAPCSAAEIRFLAKKHNVMTAFEPCGNNNFNHYAWSPDGKKLYFQLVLVAHIMDAEDPQKKVAVVPTQTPIGPAAWLTSSRLVVPVGPEADDGPNQLALFDLDQQTIYHLALPGLTAFHDMQRAADPTLLLALADGPSGRTVYRIDTKDARIEVGYPWLKAPVDTFSYNPALDVVVAGVGSKTTLYEGASGKAVGSWSPATRGTLHPNGRWLALEHEGDPVSIFYQRSWDELSERARERELARARRFEEKIASRGDFPTEVRPPMVSFVDMISGKRWQITSIYGRRFTWYEPTDHFGSLILWGFEGKEFKRNVVLGNWTDRLRHMEREATMMGVERFEAGDSTDLLTLSDRPAVAEDAAPAPDQEPTQAEK